MVDIHKLTITELVDILSTQTSLLIQMHKDGASKAEFVQCTDLIEEVQDEIKSRKKVKSK